MRPTTWLDRLPRMWGSAQSCVGCLLIRTRLACFLCVVLCSPGIGAARAQKPEIKSLSVIGVPAGQTTVVVLYGDNLDPQSAAVRAPLTVKLLGSQATDEKTKSKGNRQVSVEVAAPANCPSDTFELTLTQPDKCAVKTNLCVTSSVAMEAPIKKPASTFATAMPLPGPSAAILGQLDGDTADLVRFDGKGGEVWDISLLSSRAGSPLDPILRVRDNRHISMAISAGDKKRDRHIVFHVPSDGAYYVEITEAEAKGGPEYRYRLTVARK